MADDITLNAGAGGPALATDEISSRHYQIAKLAFGAADSATLVCADSPYPVEIKSGAITLPSGASTAANQATGNAHLSTIAGAVSGSEMQVDVIAMPTVTVTGPLTDTQLRATAVPVSGTFWQETQPVSVATVPTHAVTQSGNWPVRLQDGNGNALTSATRGSEQAASVQIVDGSGNQITSFGGSGGTAETDDAAFTAGSGSGTPAMGFYSTDTVDSGDVGVLAMDASRRQLVSLEVDNSGTKTVSGTVTANAGTNLNTSALALESGGNLAAIAGDTTSLDGKVTACNTGAVVVDSGTITTVSAVTAISNALPAGDNNIGNVDIVTHPADTFVAEGGALGKGVLLQGDDGTDRTNVLVDTDGHLKVDVVTAPATAVTGTFWQETQPVSAASLPLPSGAATEGTLSTLDGKVTACNTGAVVIASGSCAVTGTFWQETQPVSLASVPSHAVTNAGTFAVQVDGDALTSLQLIDDTVAVLGTATYTETTTKGNVVGAVRNDDLATLADTDNEIAPVQVNASGALYTESSPQVDYLFDGSAKCTIKRWQSAEAASGTNTLMSAVADKKFRILSLAVFATSDTEVSFYFEDADNTACLGTSSSKFIVDISGSSGPAGFVMGYNPAGWFEAPTANKDFEINLSAAVSVNVVIQYIEVA